MTVWKLVFTATAAGLTLAAPASAQTYATYSCVNGSRFAAAFFDGYAAIQIDGKSLILPQRVTISGARFAKSGVTLTVKGINVRIKHSGVTTDCTLE
jgi:membrane-bound inhibitor of C-type lysozyme